MAMRNVSPAAFVSHISISYPKPNQAVQGLVNITGSTNIHDFSHASLEFSYQYNPTNTWFPLAESDKAVVNDLLATWDTSTITDNVYILKLTVTTKSNQVYTYTVEGIRVRNYSAIETNTPAPLSTLNESNPTSIPTLPHFVSLTPTPFPTNPATIQSADLIRNSIWGAIIVIGLFLAGISYILIQRGSR
ncbi:MAG: hypothetical protein ACPL4H_04345 [Anaerolineales bacterium]